MDIQDKFREFVAALAPYSEAYDTLENMQCSEAPEFEFIQIGDQKTGPIGEAFIYKYLELKDEIKGLRYAGHHSNADWDLQYERPERKGPCTESQGGKCRASGNCPEHVKVQVKAVTLYATKRKTSAIKEIVCPDKLYVILLDKGFRPFKVWKSKETVPAAKSGLTVPDPNNLDATGSDVFHNNTMDNITEDFFRVMRGYLTPPGN